MSTLNDLIEEYGANGFVILETQNNISRFVRIDDEYGTDVLAKYGDVTLKKLKKSLISDDNIACNYASDWLDESSKNNIPYKVKIFF